jgi:putative transposase
MKRSKFSETHIVAVLKEAEAGVPVKEVCRKHGISDATYYNWKARYGGLGVSELKRLKELEAENTKLKRMYADLALENEAIKAVLNRKL